MPSHLLLLVAVLYYKARNRLRSQHESRCHHMHHRRWRWWRKSRAERNWTELNWTDRKRRRRTADVERQPSSKQGTCNFRCQRWWRRRYSARLQTKHAPSDQRQIQCPAQSSHLATCVVMQHNTPPIATAPCLRSIRPVLTYLLHGSVDAWPPTHYSTLHLSTAQTCGPLRLLATNKHLVYTARHKFSVRLTFIIATCFIFHPSPLSASASADPCTHVLSEHAGCWILASQDVNCYSFIYLLLRRFLLMHKPILLFTISWNAPPIRMIL